MSGLVAAHRGYEYQDLLAATRLVDMLLGTVVQAHVDEKLVPDDRFDDLTIIGTDGSRERTQFKHTDNDDRPLSLATFTADTRSLRLDCVIASCLADRNGPGSGASSFLYRIVLRDSAPTNVDLTAVLRPATVSDPGPFLLGLGTKRYRFDAQVLWAQRNDPTADAAFHFLSTITDLTFDDLEWVCCNLVVEVAAPAASADLAAPALAEQLLLARVRTEVGAEVFPNTDRRAIDVAAAMINTARAARSARLKVSTEELLRRAQLRSDFGSVSRAHPVDADLEVLRPSTVDDIVGAANQIAGSGGHLILVGPPGQGKSWVCQQVLNELEIQGWLISEHYCYLGDADGERNERVMAENIFGTLLSRLASSDPGLVSDQRPRLAADEQSLERALEKALSAEPNRRVALVIDGIDHVTRVRARFGSQFDPSRSLVEAVSTLRLPPGVVTILLSQPGRHLEPLERLGAATFAVPGLNRNELTHLSTRLKILPSQEQPTEPSHPLLQEAEAKERFLDSLERRSTGNALYATYLCRETMRFIGLEFDPASTIDNLPQFDGTLQNYYEYLYASLGNEAYWVADVIALADFSITRSELRELRPDMGHRVDGALSLLAPVLIERATQGGVRVYHESFARYLRGNYANDEEALKAVLSLIAAWLERKGLFSDPRSYRSLFPVMAEAGSDRRILDLVDRNFVSRSVAAGFTPSAVIANLCVTVSAGARLDDWGAIARCIELSRAAQAFESERYDSLVVEFAGIPVTLLGTDTFASRLMNDDRLAMSGRDGLQMCAALDRLGAIVPWQSYLRAYLREAAHDRTAYGEESNRNVVLAFIRGRLRLSSSNEPDTNTVQDNQEPFPVQGSDEASPAEIDLIAPINWGRLATTVEDKSLSYFDLITSIVDTHGSDGVLQFVQALEKPGEACLTVAESFAAQLRGEDKEFPSPFTWAVSAFGHGIPIGKIHRLFALGVDPIPTIRTPLQTRRDRLLELTQAVQRPAIQWDIPALAEFLDALCIAAHSDRDFLATVEAQILGVGWYRCWLRFVVRLCGVEADTNDQSTKSLEALRLLTGDLHPFSGDPRACDLYSMEAIIRETVERAVSLLTDQHWRDGLELLQTISDSISTTLHGELGGPLNSSFLLDLAIDTADQERLDFAREFVTREVSRSTARRYYSDIARYRLTAARLAIKASRVDEARSLWFEACEFLTAYGFHKDRTIYEVLEALPSLINADPDRARLRIAAIQGVAERIPLHTDRKGTDHAWEEWWTLLAQADPAATVRMAVPALLKRCNDPNWLQNEALTEVWEQWGHEADPILSGALRLCLESPLNKRDAQLLSSLIDQIADGRNVAKRLANWLIARADERHISYSYTNSSELIAQDDILVADINSVAQQAGLPLIGTLQRTDKNTQGARSASSSPRAHSEIARQPVDQAFPYGQLGLNRAIRTWSRKPFDAKEGDWSVDRWANLIGYRLLDLAAWGQRHEAEAALHSLSDGMDLGDRAGLLRALAEGLERHGETRLAAIAYSLCWTKTRSRGGWLAFGGENQLSSLHAATRLDSSAARSIVAQQVSKAIAIGRDSYGITQALIIAFAYDAIQIPGEPTLDTAFAAWDEALAVIDARSPRVAPSDDPEDPYEPSPQGTPQDRAAIDRAFALAIFGQLYHPGRERKRRTLLAIVLIIQQRPDVASEACGVALSTISDAATLSWLLCLLAWDIEGSETVVAACQNQLRDLASRDALTVRALARRLIREDAPPLPDWGHTDPALLRTSNRTHSANPRIPGSQGYLRATAGGRLRDAEELLPGITSAVRERMDSLFDDARVRRRLEAQLDAFADRSRKRWPNAFTVYDEMVEQSLQLVGAAGRAALRAAEDSPDDPIVYEDELASLLLNDPSLPLLLEETRVPRPSIPAPPGQADPIWARVKLRSAGTSAESTRIEEAVESEDQLDATVAIEPAEAAAWLVDNGDFSGWYWLGTMECRRSEQADGRETEELLSSRFRAVEIRDANDRNAFDLPPLTVGDLDLWLTWSLPTGTDIAFQHSQPLIGMDNALDAVGDARSGLGTPRTVLSPTEKLIGALGLEPGERLAFEDDLGTGLALVTWRTEYDRSEHYLGSPRLNGCGIVLRPDLFHRLVQLAGAGRVVIRDFISGSKDLAKDARDTDAEPNSGSN